MRGKARFEKMLPVGTPPCVVAMIAWLSEEKYFSHPFTARGTHHSRQDIIDLYMYDARGCTLYW